MIFLYISTASVTIWDETTILVDIGFSVQFLLLAVLYLNILCCVLLYARGLDPSLLFANGYRKFCISLLEVFICLLSSSNDVMIANMVTFSGLQLPWFCID